MMKYPHLIVSVMQLHGLDERGDNYDTTASYDAVGFSRMPRMKLMQRLLHDAHATRR
jgi:hypothetical protein